MEANFKALCESLGNKGTPPWDPIIDVSNVAMCTALVQALDRGNHVATIHLKVAGRAPSQMNALLSYLRHNSALRTVVFKGQGDMNWSRDVTCPLLQAMAENPHIEHVETKSTLDQLSYTVSMEDLTYFLQGKSQTLKHLVCETSQQDTDYRPQRLARAIGGLKALESFDFVTTTESFLAQQTAKLILNELQSHPCLQELSFYHTLNEDRMSCLSSMLRSSIPLVKLTLVSIPDNSMPGLTIEMAELLVQGLAACSTLVRFETDYTYGNEEGGKVLMNYFREDGAPKSSVQELYLFGDCFDLAELFAPVPTATSEGHVFCPKRHGSPLRLLELEDDGWECTPLWELLARNTSTLACLHVDNVRHWPELIRCLPQMIYLRELSLPLSYARENYDYLQLVRAMRCSGSLTKLSGPIDYYRTRGLTARQRRLVDAYCERNRVVNGVLQNCSKHENRLTHLRLVPLLYKAVQPVERTAPNSRLVALLAAGQVIGPVDDSSRSKRLNASM